MPSNHLILGWPPLLLPSIFASIRVFSSESALHIRWPKYCSFSFSISSSNEYSGLISLKMDWFDLLAVQGTLKGLLHHHSSNTSVLWHSSFFMVQLSHPYVTTGKTINWTIQTFVSKVISLLFKMLFRLVKAFFPRSKCLLISWLQSPSAVILEPKKIKSVIAFFLPLHLPWSDGTKYLDLSFSPIQTWCQGTSGERHSGQDWGMALLLKVQPGTPSPGLSVPRSSPHVHTWLQVKLGIFSVGGFGSS